MKEFWKRQISLRDFSVPLKCCLGISQGDVKNPLVRRQVHEQAQAKHFNHVVLFDGDRGAVGLIPTCYLETSRMCQFDAANVIDASVRFETTIGELLDSLCNDPAILTGETQECLQALVTVSDLNRHAFSALVYLPLAILETSLVKFIGETFKDHWNWLGKLKYQDQVELIGGWEIKKRADTDIGLVQGANLRQLLDVVSENGDLFKQLGFGSSSQARKCFKSINDLRNRVMHPVRPLVNGPRTSDAFKLKKRIQRALDLTNRVLCAIES
jgi:hypothetical protein